MGRSASPRSPRRWRRTSRGSAVKVVVGGVALTLTFGIAVLAFAMPYSADVGQPAPPGHEWVGVPPRISVRCGSLLAAQTPAYPRGTKYLHAGSGAVAADACAAERPQVLTMGITSAAVGLLLLGLIAYSTVHERRGAGGR